MGYGGWADSAGKCSMWKDGVLIDFNGNCGEHSA